MNNFFFYFPCKTKNAYSKLFCEMADYFSSFDGVSVYYVEWESGGAADLLIQSFNVRIIRYNSEELLTLLSEPSYLILPIEWLDDIPKLGGSTKIIAMLLANKKDVTFRNQPSRFSLSTYEKVFNCFSEEGALFFPKKKNDEWSFYKVSCKEEYYTTGFSVDFFSEFSSTDILKQGIGYEEYLSLVKRDKFRIWSQSTKTKISRFILKYLGAIDKRFTCLGIPIITVTKVAGNDKNIFLFFFPLFRFRNSHSGGRIHILILFWIYKAIWSLFSQRKSDVLSLPQRDLSGKLSKGQTISVCIMEPRIACWQLDEVYHLLEKDTRFSPYIVVMPFGFQGESVMKRTMEESFRFFESKGYCVYKGYDEETEEYLDVKEKLDPDVVFYSMFWKPHFHENFYFDKFTDSYLFLFNYGFDIGHHPDHESMNFPMHNNVDRFYLPSFVHKRIAEENMDNKGVNVIITGSPKMDPLFNADFIPTNVWKGEKKRKRIIWAPHHMIYNVKTNPYVLSAFIDLAVPMLFLAEKYSEEIQFAFKPHPMLREKLYKVWGKVRTDEYYLRWDTMENGQLEEGEFIDLFKLSDALILDSLSFVGEYTCTGKPLFFTYGTSSRIDFNRLGKAILDVQYFNSDKDRLLIELEAFIINVVIGGEDIKRLDREEFVKNYLAPPFNRSAAKNIYVDMVNYLFQKGEVYTDR